MYLAGVDLGGTYIKAGLVDVEGKILLKGQVPTGASDGAAAVLVRIKELIGRLAWKRGIALADLQAIGVGIPGSVDVNTGLVRMAPNLSWRDFPVRAELAAMLNLPVVVDNDAHVAALGEKWRGAGRDFNSLLMVTVGTGVGSGLIINGKIHRGFFGYGAELGHYKVDFKGLKCHCGGEGCLESLASATAMVRLARSYLADGYQSMLQDSPDLDARKIIEAAARGDQLANRVLDRATKYLSMALANVALVVGPQAIIIGGGLAQAGEIILKPIRKHVADCLGPWQVKPLPVVAARLGNDAGIIGAAYLAMNENNFPFLTSHQMAAPEDC